MKVNKREIGYVHLGEMRRRPYRHFEMPRLFTEIVDDEAKGDIIQNMGDQIKMISRNLIETEMGPLPQRPYM